MYGVPATTCFHCGDPLPASPVVAIAGAVARGFCRTGCSAAASWICEAALGDYYALRSASAGRVAVDDDDHTAWDRPELMAPHTGVVAGGRAITLVTDAMRCAACAWLIDRALMREPGVLDVSANAVTGRLRLAWDPAVTPLSALVARLAALGYPVYLAGGDAQERARRQTRRTWLLRLGVAGLGAMQAMMLAEALYLDTAQQMPVATRDFFRWVTFLVSTPVVFYAGWPFLAGMARELRQRTPGMDTLVAGSTLIAYTASLVETLRGGPHVWFDAAVMFVFLLLVARGLEHGARARATGRIDALARARPALVTRETSGGGREKVALGQLQVGDIVRVATGESVPADGALLDTAGAFDESLLTGESTPVRHGPGETVLAGSLSQDGARVRVARVGADTWLSQLARLVEQAQASRPRLARAAERWSAAFVATLVVGAVAVFAWWWQHEPARAVEVVIALLVVSCPCALALAVPAALTAAHGALAGLGVLAVQPDALSALARVDRVVFDKTGTLGDGAPVVAACTPLGAYDTATVRRIAAALEADSRHPLARAFALPSSVVVPTATARRDVASRGIEAGVEGQRWRLGRFDYVSEVATCDVAPFPTDDSGVWLGGADGIAACFTVREQPRQDASAAILALRQQGVSVELCSGDADAAVTQFAHRLGIAEWTARCAPADKLHRVRSLRSRGHVVAMVGDGINDAPVLAGADVSFAMGSGSAMAHAAADFVLTAPSLMRLPQAIALARRARRIVRQNLAWAVGYNVVALPLAATGHVTPWLAALGMAASSLLVTGNALRLLRPGRA